MLGKIKYDVEVPEIPKKVSEIVTFFDGFMADDTHKSVSVNYGNRKRGADNAYTSLRKYITKHGYDVLLNVRNNVLYITKKNFEAKTVIEIPCFPTGANEKATEKVALLHDEGAQLVVIPESIKTKQKIEQSIAKEVEAKKEVKTAKRGRPSKSKIDSDEVWAYYIMNDGSTQKEMAEHFGVATSTINKILQGKRRKKEFSEEKNGITDAELRRISGK